MRFLRKLAKVDGRARAVWSRADTCRQLSWDTIYIYTSRSETKAYVCALRDSIRVWEEDYEIPLKERSLRTESESGGARAGPARYIIADTEFGPDAPKKFKEKYGAISRRNRKKILNQFSNTNKDGKHPRRIFEYGVIFLSSLNLSSRLCIYI